MYKLIQSNYHPFMDSLSKNPGQRGERFDEEGEIQVDAEPLPPHFGREENVLPLQETNQNNIPESQAQKKEQRGKKPTRARKGKGKKAPTRKQVTLPEEFDEIEEIQPEEEDVMREE